MSTFCASPRLLLCANASRPLARRTVALRWRTGPVAKITETWRCGAAIRHYSIPPDTRPKIDRSRPKVWKNADEAVADIQSGSTILSAGFGLCGTPGRLNILGETTTNMYAETLIHAIARRGAENLNNLTAVSNNAGVPGKGGLSILAENGLVNKLIMSFVGNNKVLEKKYLTGSLVIELCPQGSLAERIRAAGAGIPAFFTPTATSKFATALTAVANGSRYSS